MLPFGAEHSVFWSRLPVVLYGCASLTLREEHRENRENRVLKRIVGPTRDELTGGWKNYTMRSYMVALFAKCN
jgi:hypothetical protein